MKAAAFPGAARKARRLKKRGRRRSTLCTISVGHWTTTFRILGVGIVHVPTLASRRQQTLPPPPFPPGVIPCP